MSHRKVKTLRSFAKNSDETTPTWALQSITAAHNKGPIKRIESIKKTDNSIDSQAQSCFPPSHAALVDETVREAMSL